MVNHADDKDDFEDEFEFDLDDEFDEDEEDTKQKPAPAGVVADRGKSKFPWLVAVAALGAVGFVGYKFVQMGDTSDEIGEISQPAPEPAQAVAAPKTPADRQPETTAADPTFALDSQLDSLSTMSEEKKSDDSFFTDGAEASSDVKSAVSDATAEIEKALAGLKKEIADLGNTSKNVKNNKKDIELTASKIVNLDKSMSNIQQDIKQLTRIVKSLVEQVNYLQAAKTQVNAAREAKARQSGSSSSSSPKNYVSDSMTIHAIIPGRAGLRTQGGKTVSITEGDMLGEYGKVLKIDAPTGSVITSSGVTIR